LKAGVNVFNVFLIQIVYAVLELCLLASLLQGGWCAVILLMQQLTEELCFLASPFSMAKDLSTVPV